MNKKVVAVAMTMAIATSSIGFTTYANPYDGQVSEKTNQYKSAQEKLDQINAEIQKLDNQISNLIVDIDETNNKIGKTEKDIKTTDDNVKATEKDIKDEEELFSQRMRTMYMNGMDSYVEVILKSEGFSDLISRLENIKQIISYDKELVGSLSKKKNSLEAQKKELEEKKNELVSLKSENDQKMKQLENEKKSHKAKFEVAQKEINKLSAELDNLKTAQNNYEEQARQQIQAAQEAAQAQARPSRGDSYDSSSSNSESSSNGGSTVTGSATGQAIVSYAMNFLGVEYVWGGTTPQGFDCSGFTQYVYANFGIDITRTTYTQIGQGRAVSSGELAPGDLVFFGYGGSPDHVGIYIGGGQYIHAPQSGEVIKISPLTRSDYMAARRIVE